MERSDRRRDQWPFHSRLFVGNFDNKNISREQLEKIFSAYGNVEEKIHIHQGYAFVQYASEESATRALNGENGRILGLKKIEIQYAKALSRHRRRDNNNNFQQRNERSYLGKRKRNETYPPRKRSRISDLSYPIVRIPLFVFDYSLANYAQSVRKHFHDYGKIGCDVFYVGQNFVKNPPNEKYIIYIFTRNVQTNTLCFCAVKDNGTTPGFLDTPINTVMKYVQNEVLPPEKTPPSTTNTSQHQVNTNYVYPQTSSYPQTTRPQVRSAVAVQPVQPVYTPTYVQTTNVVRPIQNIQTLPQQNYVPHTTTVQRVGSYQGNSQLLSHTLASQNTQIQKPPRVLGVGSNSGGNIVPNSSNLSSLLTKLSTMKKR